MASKQKPKKRSKTVGKAKAGGKAQPNSKPLYPYTTTPSLLRKFLEQVPKKPRPPQVNFALLQTWGIRNNNARTVIKVIRDLGLIDGSNSPTQHYNEFMNNATGAATLAGRIKDVYNSLFSSFLEPHKEPFENLKNFFNINSGGSESAILYQVHTFKALCEFADFTTLQALGPGTSQEDRRVNISTGSPNIQPNLQIDLHIHLPENKSRVDYEEIIKDIAKYIYGK